MISVSIIVSPVVFLLVGAQDIEMLLAQKNIEGYPTSLLYESASLSRNEASNMDKNKLSQLLESKEVRDAVTKAALEYSSKELNKSGQARYLMSDEPGMCAYQWISWLPWMGCDTPATKESSSSLPLVYESAPSCY